MPKEANNQKIQPDKKEAPKTPLTTQVEFTVMPKEFRKAPPKKLITPKLLIIGGAVLGAAVLSIVGVVIFTKKPPTKVVLKPEPPIATTTAPTTKPTEAVTTTPVSLTQPTPTTKEEAPAPLPAIPGELVQGTDTDADGLTEKEEAIFQTDSKRPDTDADGFLDGNEVFHLYNPSAVAPVDLLASGIVKLYRNASEGYSIYYPALWSTSSTSDTSMVSFLAVDTESINVTAKKTVASITLRSWYLSEYPKADINELQSYTSKEGYQGLQDKNRLTTYIKEGNKVLIIKYILGKTSTIWYRRLYDMMLNSLKIE